MLDRAATRRAFADPYAFPASAFYRLLSRTFASTDWPLDLAPATATAAVFGRSTVATRPGSAASRPATKQRPTTRHGAWLIRRSAAQRQQLRRPERDAEPLHAGVELLKSLSQPGGAVHWCSGHIGWIRLGQRLSRSTLAT
jgi:hypothetical protein